MIYSLWSQDTLLGEAELNERPGFDGVLTGAFRAVDRGHPALAVFSEFQAALAEMGRRMERQGLAMDRPDLPGDPEALEVLRDSPEGQRVMETAVHTGDVALELRDAGGTRMSTKQIFVYDLWAAVPQIAETTPAQRAEMEAAGVHQYLLCAIVEGADAPR